MKVTKLIREYIEEKIGEKKLQPGKKYFVKIRAYKKVNGETVYGKYSTPKSSQHTVRNSILIRSCASFSSS